MVSAPESGGPGSVVVVVPGSDQVVGVSSHAFLAHNKRLFISLTSCAILGGKVFAVLGDGALPGSLDGPDSVGSGIFTANGGVPGNDLVSRERSSSSPRDFITDRAVSFALNSSSETYNDIIIQ